MVRYGCLRGSVPAAETDVIRALGGGDRPGRCGVAHQKRGGWWTWAADDVGWRSRTLAAGRRWAGTGDIGNLEHAAALACPAVETASSTGLDAALRAGGNTRACGIQAVPLDVPTLAMVSAMHRIGNGRPAR